MQKIEGRHLERLALIYLRQSSPRQVRENFRSTERQYSLADEAARLGWAPERVVTIDGDLGLSGRDTRARGGYKELVGRVCLGEVGAIFGLEVSRLARSSAETQRLLEYCGLTDTLVIDTDGIYDLRDFNDQLVLGVKGQLAQAELHIMAVRLQGAKRHAAQRGELRFPLPVGLVHDDEGRTVIDPDEEVQAAISDLFKAFAQTGSGYGVVGAFKDRRFPRRAYGGAWAGELRWGRLTHARAVGVLSNPSYAGAYVFGRYRSQRVLRPDGTITTRTVELPRSEWQVVIHDHHEGYIGWEQFLANEQRLAANNNRNGQRPPREGRALCQGILRCGACGGSMTTLHRREGSYYECGHSRADHINTPGCRSVKATVVDELIARRLLEALAPEEIKLALAAADEHADRRARSDRVFGLRVERARYEAARAERAFHACEPDNRLVARTLENRWEEKLRELKDAEAELSEHVVPAVEPSREQLDALARDLPALWAAQSTAHRDRKRLLRALIADITLTSQPDSRELQVGIRWQSGASEQHTIERPLKPADAQRTPAPAVELITRLSSERHTSMQIVEQLNAAGLRTGKGQPFTARNVQWIRWRHKIPYPTTWAQDGELTVSQTANTLGVSVGTIYAWISTGKLAAHRGPGNRLYIPFGPEVEQQSRERVQNSVHLPAETKTRATGGAV
ncbi:MAG TPA: recombinase family protein [Solirubrobacteraceae bacterium]|nr:recombinase family protein [Solirubrobacteraceae bacterium]